MFYKSTVFVKECHILGFSIFLIYVKSTNFNFDSYIFS